MQTLTVVARLFPALLSGKKRATIRWREARIAPGPLLYVCEGAPHRRVVVEALRCTDMPLREAAAFLGRARDWPDPVMVEGMREHYPAIALDDTVQVIEHGPPRTAAGHGAPFGP
jgi:hypothetical protein